ncbi:hypothetical protein G9A89_015532 [Geosiphon pyriformis]|nr:hypothetical protein G9A89_015532 [Geosiphon pyriformis]
MQVLNQFIKKLWSSILRSNKKQTINLAINGNSDIDTKIIQLSKKLIQKIEEFLARTTGTYQPPQQRENNNNKYLQQQNPPTGYPNQASYLSLTENQSFDKSTSVEGKDIEQISQPSKQTKSNIPPAIITKDTILAAIFLFNIDNLNTHSLFSGAAINQDKPIMALYTNAKVREINIKLILNIDGNTKTLIRKIDNFSFKIKEIQILTKVLVMEATQYQALVGNNWLSKANTTLDWNTKNFNSCSTDSMPKPIRFHGWMIIKLNYPHHQSGKKKKRQNRRGTPIKEAIYYRRMYWRQQKMTHYQQILLQILCKWDNMPCLACGKILPNERLWNNVSGRRETCDEACQYTILINN